MRQMRLEKREIKDPAELEKVLDACKVVRIGTMDAEGMFIVPVNFGYEFCQKERSLKLYIHSAKEGRKDTWKNFIAVGLPKSIGTTKIK